MASGNNNKWTKPTKQNLLFNSKHDHVLFLLAVEHRDDDKDYNMLNNNVLRSNGLSMSVFVHV